MPHQTYTRKVESLGVLHILLGQLCQLSCWFDVMPLPDDYYEITVKHEREHDLDGLITKYMGVGI